MREFRMIAVMVLCLLVLVLAGAVYLALRPGPGSLDSVAARRIDRFCGFHAECQVRLGDLFDGDWDEFYEFKADVSQRELDNALGRGKAEISEEQRLIVLTRKGEVIAKVDERDGSETPSEREVLFDNPARPERHWVKLPHDAYLRVHTFPVDAATGGGGSYYVLSPDLER